ncbi:MAG: T9SS type A sorting domain-containing protein [Flavobacteriales bacterium]|nr:T9SS type A sorting domain-containing protein [Flavobacteriales bacterium]
MTNAPANYFNREVTTLTTWATSTAGTAISATCRYSNTAPATFPAAGQTYVYAPCESSVSASATPPGPFCGAASTTLTATGPGTITWAPATGLSGTTGSSVTCTATSTTTYTVTATDGGCVYTNTVTVTVNPAPEISATTATPNPICFNGDSDLNVAATGEAAPFAGAYCASTHTSGSCGFSEGDKITLVVLGTLSNPSGCVANPGYADFTSVPAPTINTSSNPHTVSISMGPDGNQFAAAWIDYNHDGDFVDTDEFLGASGNVGSNGTANIVFSIPPGALNGITRMRVIGGNDAAILSTQSCGASSSTFGDTEDYNVRIAGASSVPLTYLWTPNTFLDFDNIANPEATNVNVASIGYSVLVTHPNGCTATGNVTLNTSAPISSASITGNLAYCVGGFTTLTAVPDDGGGPFTYLWSPGGEVTASIDASSIGNYSCQVTDNCGGSVNTGDVSVTENPLPTVTCPADFDVCLDEAPIALTGGNPTPGTYSGPGVSGGNFDPSAAGLGTHTITYSHTDGNGCTNTCTFEITVNPTPIWYADNDGDTYGSGTPPATLINENFTSLAGALGSGWAQQNLSTTIGTPPTWFQGNDVTFPANSAPATGYAAANFNNTTGTNTISNWLFTPQVLLQNGAQFSFYTREVTGNIFPDRLQVRMSTNGASVNAGANATSVGDFTTLLLDINPTLVTGVYPQTWTQFTITVSGLGSPVNGRFAFRYFVTNGGPSGANSNYIGIDDVQYVLPASGILEACTQPMGYVANNSDCNDSDANLTITGNACDDGNANTVLDVVTGSCTCAGTPCTTDIDIVYQADGTDDLFWELRQQGSNILVQNGGGSLVGTGTQGTCLPDGDFYLVVTDDGGDGIVGGGYILKINSAQRLIDNRYDEFGRGGFTSGATSQIAGGEGFTLPIGTDRLITASCDRHDWRTTCTPEYVVANGNALVTAQYGVTNNTSGYQMWWYNPNGGYSFKRIQYHSTTNGLPASATRAAHFRINAWSGNQLVDGTFYNVKVRGIVNTAFQPWGAACRFMINNAEANCPRTKLNTGTSAQFLSCNQTKAIAGNVYVYANPVRRLQPGCASYLNANRYQFRFRIVSESFELIKTSATGQYLVNTIGLSCGKTYEVDVRASFDNGATWCHTGSLWGDMCLLTTPNCVQGGGNQNMAQEGGASELRMYPNPNRGDQLFVNLTGIDASVETVSVDIYDAFGKRVSARTIATQDGFVNTIMQLNGELAAGLYTVSITAGEQQFNERLVVQP